MAGKEKLVKNTEKPIQKYRFIIQVLFVMLCIWIGIEFYFFINYLESGGAAAYTERPPGVDGFLPISSFMSFYLFVATGQIHSAHPAGFFIFLTIILVSLVFGKAFCSWLCPIGFLSELIADFGDKIFKRRIKLPKWLDYPLRSLKYLMLAFLFYSVIVIMNVVAVDAFLSSPYNLVSDIKMYYFFADISRFSLIIIGVLFLMSIVIRNFWCRYLCPYGALLGITALLSPSKIKRNVDKCVDCGLCNKVCPGFIKIDKAKTVISDECTTCMNCVDVCPVDNTLQLETVGLKKKINKRFVAIGLVSLFMIITGAGLVTGNWQNNITKEESLYYHKHLNTYGHPTSTESVKRFNREVNKQQN
jgi:polyferredoxin